MYIDLTKIPSTPGVYKFFNKHEIIYIGKAKNLKKRVSSYFGKSYKDRKTSQIKFLLTMSRPLLPRMKLKLYCWSKCY